jgi:hypothetical protein
VNPALKARVLDAAAAQVSPTRAAVARRNRLMGLAAVLGGVGPFIGFAALTSESWVPLGGETASQQLFERPASLVVMTVVGALGIAAAASWLGLWRGRSMLGRSREVLLACGILIPAGLFAWKVSVSLDLPGAMSPWPERSGLRCLWLSLLVAIGPLISFLAIRRKAPVQPALNGMTIGLAAGAWAWVAVDVWCPVAYVPHLLLGHVLPVIVLAGVGALLGQAFLSVRPRSRRFRT